MKEAFYPVLISVYFRRKSMGLFLAIRLIILKVIGVWLIGQQSTGSHLVPTCERE